MLKGRCNYGTTQLRDLTDLWPRQRQSSVSMYALLSLITPLTLADEKPDLFRTCLDQAGVRLAVMCYRNFSKSVLSSYTSSIRRRIDDFAVSSFRAN